MKPVQISHSPEDFRALSRRILHLAISKVAKTEFLREVLKMLIEFSACEEVELQVVEEENVFRYRATASPESPFRFETQKLSKSRDGELAHTHVDPVDGTGQSGTVIPLVVGKESIGLLQLKRKRGAALTKEEVERYEDVAQTLAAGLASQRAQAALRERVKELTCLYGIAQVAERPGTSLEDVLQGIVELLPPAWQYPDAVARIIFDERAHSTAGFRQSGQKQWADIVVNGERRGLVEVVYPEARPELDEGPFLKEERHLIDAVASQVAFIIERRQAQEEKSQLREQLMHADRLATIGQLAAGVAHELNEPLGNILGFAQLAGKCPELPGQAGQDLRKIERATVHAREIIRKLLVFARQMASRRTQINLNRVIEEGLYFLEARCAKSGIELTRSLSPDLPEIVGDAALLNQVLVNLVVNAVQAMPDGGKLKVETATAEGHVRLMVEDTGLGMSNETMKQIFVPFFTTKDVGQGTGLGLSVVHGIVTSHGGSIEAKSEFGQGTRFEVRLPIDGRCEAEEDG